MSCCPPSPPTSKINDFSSGEGVSSSSGDIRPDEPVECYGSRTGNPTGKQDDATENVLNKIDNSTIAIIRGSSISINEKFKLTAGSNKVASTWEYSPSITGISFNGNVLSGNFQQSDLGKTFKIKVVAKENSGQEIDSRTFTITPTKENSGDTLKLISPLPDGIVNSKFGPRMHPIHKVMKMHTGIDMKMANRSVVDVVAAADGEVLYTGFSNSYGKNVKIAHKNTSGKTIGITTYNHLANIYVSQGQKVIAGQKIGKEGSTGASTGNHLHFELKTPEGKFIDPLPFMSGGAVVANKTNPDGSEDQSSLEKIDGKNASVSASEMEAKDKCPPPSGPDTPTDPNNPTPTEGMPPSSNTGPLTEKDIFDMAWDIAMKSEVGPHWKSSPQFSPGDPELDAGLISTKTQRRKCGYKVWAGALGGATKFGISSSTGLKINVDSLTHEQCKAIGYNNYWKQPQTIAKPQSLAATNPYIAVLLFDILFMSWQFARTAWNKFSLGSLPAKSKNEQIQICEQISLEHLQYLQQVAKDKEKTGTKFPLEGVSARVNKRLSMVKGLSL